MQATPLFLGACALASIAGVVSGTSINTRPIQRGGIGMSEIARPEIDFASDGGLSAQVDLPDHYALQTPEGRFGVAELSTRGIYAQRRFAWREASWTPPTEPVVEDWADRAEPQPVAAEAPDPADPVSPPEPAPSDGEARLIDVGLALASE